LSAFDNGPVKTPFKICVYISHGSVSVFIAHQHADARY